MSFSEKLENFFAEEVIDCVVLDPLKFKHKLDIGSEAFSYLSKAENINSITSSISTGVGASTAVGLSWISSLGVMGKAGLIIGTVAPPIGWMVFAGLNAAALSYGIQHFFKKAKKDGITEIPKFVNTPLDLLASSVVTLIAPVMVLIGKSDGNFCNQEREFIASYFESEWGISRNYVVRQINSLTGMESKQVYDQLDRLLNEIESTGDVKRESVVSELVNVVKKLIEIDGEVHDLEISELRKIEALVKKSSPFEEKLKLVNEKFLVMNQSLRKIKESGRDLMSKKVLS